jgi:hypothetical protein
MGTMTRIMIATIVTATCLGTGSAIAADNPKLAQMFEEDQADRRGHPAEINWFSVGPRDRERQQAALEIIKGGGLTTANDYFHAAMVFQHSGSIDGIELARSLAVLASRMAPESVPVRWLSAASWDRLLMRKKRPQWYGTQFTKDNETRKWVLYQVDETAVTDAERERHGVPPLSEARRSSGSNPSMARNTPVCRTRSSSNSGSG